MFQCKISKVRRSEGEGKRKYDGKESYGKWKRKCELSTAYNYQQTNGQTEGQTDSNTCKVDSLQKINKESSHKLVFIESIKKASLII